MSGLGKVLGAAAGVTGAVGALTLGGWTAQRRVMRRYRAHVAADGRGFDSLPAERSYTVTSADGLGIYVEEVGPVDAPLTVIFSHGWTLRMGAWHFQRLGLAGPGFGAEVAAADRRDAAAATDTAATDPAATVADLVADPGAEARLVFYDQRSHGRSGRADPGRSTLDAVAEDLHAVIATAAPHGPVVVVGHSMGGMALMGLAAAEPDLVRERLAGFALIDSSAFYLRAKGSRAGLTGNLPLMRAVTATASRFPRALERGRPLARDAVWLLTRSYGFADPAVNVDLVDYLDLMISEVPVDVIAQFLPAILTLDVRAGFAALHHLPGRVICGEQDRMTPPAQSRALVAAMPSTELVLVPHGGHNLMLEQPVAVNDALSGLLADVLQRVRAADAATTATSTARLRGGR
ncbi:alpha/beta hydrolase [Nakamurella sp. A5-74]|uniref:Alpha/beta hydrolase n=1 Tax=Nakamurella sp. A5-74 TaxID=3158264 RepID=A0AAU8DSL2_9ACTN